MPRVLLVKTSSLGDAVHNLPVVSDLVGALPGVTIDWVVEEGFAVIPRLHPGVSRVLPVAVRRWRKSPWSTVVRSEVSRFLGELHSKTYDAVIDTQGLLKSALIARAAYGVRHGLDWSSSREPLGWLYDHTHHVPWGQHAVERNRQLAAQAMGYRLPAAALYGIAAANRHFSWLAAGSRHAVLLHATSAERKLWPEARWVELGQTLASRDLICVLPWGSAAEQARSQRLAQQIPQAIVPYRLDLDSLSSLLGQASVVVGTDTGLAHLAGALGAPTVGLYCATDPAATGLHACARAVNLGGIGRAPEVAAVLTAIEGLMR
ncbi:MAG: lipopolysaccharide heptosyltransferase I [Burkholderiales bacterium]